MGIDRDNLMSTTAVLDFICAAGRRCFVGVVPVDIIEEDLQQNLDL